MTSLGVEHLVLYFLKKDWMVARSLLDCNSISCHDNNNSYLYISTVTVCITLKNFNFLIIKFLHDTGVLLEFLSLPLHDMVLHFLFWELCPVHNSG